MSCSALFSSYSEFCLAIRISFGRRIGSFLLGDRLTGESYVNFLTWDLNETLQDIRLHVMWFMQDATLRHILPMFLENS